MRAAALVAVLMTALAPLGANAGALGTQRISGKSIAAAAGAVLAHFTRDANAGYVPAASVADQLVSGGHVNLRAQSPIGTSSFVNVPVQIEVDGRLDRTVLVGYRVQEYVQTAVAARDLAPGTVLQSDDLVIGRVPFSGRPVNGMEALVGRKTTVALLKGSAVAFSDTSVNQIVKAGATIVFTVRNGPVSIAADMIARSAGGLGEQVFVFSLATHKQLSGTVTGPNSVELDITEGSTP